MVAVVTIKKNVRQEMRSSMARQIIELIPLHVFATFVNRLATSCPTSGTIVKIVFLLVRIKNE